MWPFTRKPRVTDAAKAMSLAARSSASAKATATLRLMAVTGKDSPALRRIVGQG